MTTSARVHAFNQTPLGPAAQLRRLNHITAKEPNRAEARLIVIAKGPGCGRGAFRILAAALGSGRDTARAAPNTAWRTRPLSV